MDVPSTQAIKASSVFSRELMVIVFWVAIVLVVPSVVASGIWEIIMTMTTIGNIDENTKISIISIFAFPFVFLFLIQIPKANNLETVKKYYSIKPINLQVLAYCIVVAILYYAAIELFSYYIKVPSETFMDELRIQMSSKLGAICIILSICVCAPILEECLFRGLLYNYFIKTRLSVVGAVIIPSLVFSAIHLQYGSLFTFVTLFFGGILLGVVRCKTQNLLYPMIVHSIYNIFTLIGLFY